MRLKILFAVLAILLIFSGYACKKKIVVPGELLGVWKTTEPAYEGCYFDIKEDRVSIKTIEGSVYVNTIIGVKEDKKMSTKDRIYYIISCLTPDKVKDELRLYYSPIEKPGMIRFVNQEKIAWTK
jgi:hypothetical protein